MKSIKLFLYALIGMTCLALWTAWQHDYAPVPKEVTATQQVDTQSKATDKSSSVNSTKEQTSSQTTFISKTPKQRLIKVHTNVLEVTIDRQNGNVIGTKLLKYGKSLTQKDVPTQILTDKPEHFYVAQNSITGKVGNANLPKSILFSSVQKNYVLAPGQKELNVKLLWRGDNGIVVSKTFKFERNKYNITVNTKINNRSAQNFQGKLSNQITQKAEPVKHSLFSFHTFSGPSISSSAKAYEKLNYKELAEKDLARTIKGGWLAFQQPYFLSAWVPNQDQTLHYYSSKKTDDNIFTVGFSQKMNLEPKDSATSVTTLYIGPEIAENLKALAPHLDKTIDYGWLWFISALIFWIMEKLYKVVGNWGWSIILVTLLIKIVFYKFSEKSYVSMAKMRNLAPRIKALQERFSKDKQALSKATMELYKKEKVNPLGGCLPIIIQIPVFIALYYVLLEAVQLRHAPFIFWIHDLSSKDPYYILPILMGISMLIQQKLNPPPPDPTQAKMMMILPVAFTVFFISFPAGLVLYWLVNNFLSILQQWYIMRKVSDKK